MHTKPLQNLLPNNSTSYIINCTTYYIRDTYSDTYSVCTKGIVVIITILKGLVPQNLIGVTLPQENRKWSFILPAWETCHSKVWYSHNFNIFKAKLVHTPNHSTTKRAATFYTATKCFLWSPLATSPTATATPVHEVEEEIRRHHQKKSFVP